MLMRSLFFLGLAALTAPAAAMPLADTVPGAISGDRQMGTSRIELAVGGFDDGDVPRQAVTGAVTQRAWRIDGARRTPAALMKPLEDRLAAQGFDTVFACRDVDCGGFDFRFALDLLPAPLMYVDLGDFLYLAARRPSDDGRDEVVSIVTSRSSRAGFVHVTHVGPAAAPGPAVTLSTRNASDPMIETLAADGRAVLEGLDFAPGAATITGQQGATIAQLADWLAANPDRGLTLEGYTDSRGARDTNLALSEARADAVRDRLVEDWGVDPARLSVRGLGPSRPRASNDTAEGRSLNRRVEVVVTR